MNLKVAILAAAIFLLQCSHAQSASTSKDVEASDSGNVTEKTPTFSTVISVSSTSSSDAKTPIQTTAKPSTTVSSGSTKKSEDEAGAPAALTEQSTPAPKETLGPVVKIEPGNLRPLELTSRGGRKYYAFKGIPYANPTSGFQRFKEAGPVSAWSETRNATFYGPSCVQYNVITRAVEGEEDCLTLNIFTPQLPNESGNDQANRLPVMVFFHQGAFMFGTSGDFQEKYMMDEDVVLVTVNYRLGPFGFLNTRGDSDAKGNQGLKDQVLALKFVQDNIAQFNGEPNLVTLFGESAGGAAVHYHLLSERSKGLFSRAISMTGSVLSPWAYTRSPRKNAKKLGTLLNCPTTDMSELVTCLQNHDAKMIALKTKDLYEWNIDPITPFGPSVEVEESLTSFMTQTPYSLMKEGHITDAAPWMVGVVDEVCLLDAWSVLVDPQLREDMNVDWHRIAPTSFWFKETALEPDAVSNQIRAYYFGTKDIGNDTAANLTHLYSDRYFNHGIRTSALLHARYNEAIPVYLYIFSYRGKHSHLEFAGVSDNMGASEGDDLQYLFNNNRFEDISLNSTDGELSQKYIKLWVSFAREGKPTNVWGKEEWTRITPAQVKGDEALKYYSLNKDCGFIDEPFTARMNFWDNLPLNENENEIPVSSVSRGSSGDDDIFSRFS